MPGGALGQNGPLGENLMKAAFQGQVDIGHRDWQAKIDKAGDAVIRDAAGNDAVVMPQGQDRR